MHFFIPEGFDRVVGVSYFEANTGIYFASTNGRTIVDLIELAQGLSRVKIEIVAS